MKLLINIDPQFVALLKRWAAEIKKMNVVSSLFFTFDDNEIRISTSYDDVEINLFYFEYVMTAKYTTTGYKINSQRPNNLIAIKMLDVNSFIEMIGHIDDISSEVALGLTKDGEKRFLKCTTYANNNSIEYKMRTEIDLCFDDIKEVPGKTDSRIISVAASITRISSFLDVAHQLESPVELQIILEPNDKVTIKMKTKKAKLVMQDLAALQKPAEDIETKKFKLFMPQKLVRPLRNGLMGYTHGIISLTRDQELIFENIQIDTKENEVARSLFIVPRYVFTDEQ